MASKPTKFLWPLDLAIWTHETTNLVTYGIAYMKTPMFLRSFNVLVLLREVGHSCLTLLHVGDPYGKGYVATWCYGLALVRQGICSHRAC